MGKDFWQTLQQAIERDSWTARLAVTLMPVGAVALVAWAVVMRG